VKLPRWTVYPALAVLGVFLLPAIPRKSEPRPAGATSGADVLPAPMHKRVVVLGIDGLDPEILQEVIARFPERMTNFQRLIDEGELHPLGTSCPPQSPVAWSNFITGFDPGGHGIFDFIHRDLVLRTPIPSTTTPVEAGELLGWKGGLFGSSWVLPLPGDGGESNRTGAAFWEILAENGIPSDIWRMPANFPVVPAKGVSFSGMMTPALDSAYGEFTFYTSNPPVDTHITGGKIEPVREYEGEIATRLLGPGNVFKYDAPTVSVPMTIFVDRDANACAIDTGEDVLVLQPGAWSDFTEVTFKFLPGWLAVPMDAVAPGSGSLKGTVRFYLRRLLDDTGGPAFELYASPVNIDPLSPGPMSVSEPSDASADVAEAIGIYYTQGMPEDVAALKTEMLTDEEFMAQSELVHDEAERMLDYALDRYCAKDDGGLLFFYFSGVDLCGHMMWRHADEEHPDHDPAYAARDSSDWSKREGSTWKDVIHDLYLQMDTVLGEVRQRVGDDTLLIVMSDHGFAPYRRKFNLNTWLYENGYLVLKDGVDKELPKDAAAHQDVHIFVDVDWSKTRAYGMGFNGLYLNLQGRELDNPDTPEDESGIVASAEAPALLAEISEKLLAIRDAEYSGTQVVLRCDLASEVYAGDRQAEAPDILVGYNSGYGNSDPGSLGRVTHNILEDNLGGTFNGSHLMAPEVVAGTLLTNAEVLEGEHALEDLTVEILRQYGIEPGQGMLGHPVLK
jgi:predicted AlkP superfamily phosphohydrolase/phosphomutase